EASGAVGGHERPRRRPGQGRLLPAAAATARPVRLHGPSYVLTAAVPSPTACLLLGGGASWLRRRRNAPPPVCLCAALFPPGWQSICIYTRHGEAHAVAPSRRLAHPVLGVRDLAAAAAAGDRRRLGTQLPPQPVLGWQQVPAQGEGRGRAQARR